MELPSYPGNKPMPHMTTLCASKAALNHFSRCVAMEEGPNGIRVNTLSPGAVVTPMSTLMTNGQPSDKKEE